MLGIVAWRLLFGNLPLRVELGSPHRHKLIDLHGHAALQDAAGQVPDQHLLVLSGAARERHVDVDVGLRFGPDDAFAQRGRRLFGPRDVAVASVGWAKRSVPTFIFDIATVGFASLSATLQVRTTHRLSRR